MATLGYVRSSNGPDLAQVGANEQLVSHVFPNTTGETLRITSVSAWVGNWSGQATMRFGIWAASSSSAAPGALLARTVEFSPTVSYVDAAGGQLRTVSLETPYDLAPGQVIALGVASRGNSAGIAMFQASAISQPNESFYRRSISGTNMIAAGGEVTNQGQLAIYVTGTTNQPPTAPTGLTPSGTITGTLKPVLSLIHNDPNGNPSSQVRVQVQTTAGATRWDRTLPFNVQDGGRGNIGYDGAALNFYTSYRWRAKTWDNHGVEGPFSDWVNFTIQHNNRAPNAPTNFSPPVGAELSGSLTVTMHTDFTDPDLPLLPDGQEWEQFSAKQVRLRQASNNSYVYNSGIVPTTTAEKNALRSTTTVTLPQRGVLYIREERHRDRRGEWSPYALAYITVVNGASVDRPTSPSGRITNPSNPGTISAVYHHSGGLSGTMWQAGLFNEFGGLITTSNVFSGSSFASGTTLNASWMFGTLDDGIEYQVRVRALSTPAEGWSPWSIGSIITTNAAPNTPVLQAPNADPRSLLPGLSVRATDPDQPPSQVAVEIEVYDDAETLLDTVNAPLNTAHTLNNVYAVSVAALEAIIPDYGTYYWRAQANDGYLDSPWSSMFTLNYYPVPAVEITGPTGPIVTTSQPQLEVTADAHTHWRVVGRSTNNQIVYDTGEVSGTIAGHTVSSSQYWIGDERWNNNETFHWTAMVRSAAGVWGSSAALTLTLEYIPPDPLIVESVEAMAFYGVKGTHYTAISISQPNVTEESFIRTIVDRVEIDGMDGDEVPGTMRRAHFETGSTTETSFADFDMTSNQWYRYTLRYEVQSGVDVISSNPVYAESVIGFYGVLMHMPFDPLNTVVWLPYGTERYEPEVEWVQGHYEVITTNGRAPYGYSNSMDFVVWRHQSVLVPRDDMSPEQQRDALRQLWKYQNARFAPNGRPNSVCFREGRGGDDGRVYGRIANPRRVHSHARLYTVEFEFRELEEIPAEGGGA